MARPIQDTPILKGEDSKNFMRNVLKQLEWQKTPEGQKKIKEDWERIEKHSRLI